MHACMHSSQQTPPLVYTSMHMLSDMSAQGLIISCLFTPVTVGEEGNRDASRILRCAHAASAAFYE